ncbi:MAG: TolC family protein [Phycisphaerales bacterium]|nr:TolC family protein [Phycisphaerales bacterium]
MKERCALAVFVIWPSVWAGCATVDPRPDFDRTSQHVKEAAGESLPQFEDDAPTREALVDELLAAGLTVDEAVKIALLNNTNVRAALARVGMARADAVQAGLFTNPTLGLSLRFPEGGGLANLEAGVAQNIADLWLIPPRKRAAERDLDRTILEVAREVVSLTIDTRTAYFNAVASDQALTIAQDNVALTKKLMEVTEARLEAGAVGALDSNLAKGQALRAEVDFRTARLEAASARRTLAKALAITTLAADLSLTDPLPSIQEQVIDTERLVSMAREFRLDLRAAHDGVAATEARVKAEYAKVFPNLDIGLELERPERRAQPGRNILADTARASIANGGLTVPDIESRGQRNQAQSEEIDLLMGPSFGITLPIFDQNQAQIAKARFAHEQAIAILQALDRAIVQETREAADRASTAWSVATLYDRELLPQVRNTLSISEAAYQAGNTPILNVIDAQRSLLESRRGYVTALQAAANAFVELERAVARPIDVILAPPEPPRDATPNQSDKGNPQGGQP